MSIAQLVESVVDGPLPLRFDGLRRQSAAGPEASQRRMRIDTPRGVAYLATAPGDLGLARAYVAGDLDPRRGPSRGPVRPARRPGRRPVPPAGAGGPARAVAHARRPRAHPAVPAAPGEPAAVAPGGRGGAALDDPRRPRDPPPLRRLEPLLRAGARAVDGLHLRVLPRPGRDARGGAGEQVRPGLRQAGARAGRPAARRRLRVGRDGPVRGPPGTSRCSGSRCRGSRRCGARRPSPTRV